MPNPFLHGGTVSRNMLWVVGWQPYFCPVTIPQLAVFRLGTHFWRRADYLITLASRRNYQLRNNSAVDITLLSIASLPYATFVLAINVIGVELEYLTGHCDPSDIPCLSAFIRAACRSSSWQHGRMKSKKLPPQKPYASLRSAFGLPRNAPWSISRCIWFGRIWRGSRSKACVTDPITLGIIRFVAFEQKIHTINNSLKCKSVSKNVGIPTFCYSFQNREE